MFEFVQKRSEKTNYLVGREWFALTKALKEYKKAEAEGNMNTMVKLAKKIRLIQQNLGIKQSEFPNLSL
ncbi:MAG TPA: hypothetical protein VFM64_04695 [Candidatus Nitrosotenuis sp.]|nr:hypothetical protein [Candidatus Nitrosotenuis sp.]